MKSMYVVKRGPVQPPASLYGPREPLQDGDTLVSAENPWLRGCIREGRLALAPKRKGKTRDK